ncbi:TlpA family protein disulfide reductase [Lacinutrix sp. C3R15]|uniref:TlpA family protein disulfide reductase n=1 Tax=Flavobacteriaceae TaxID=49546 RepID=UPI001C095D4C|nr:MULTISPECIES: TlpA disulfide reductase family protein [Flavobacteriaceae]MBU2939267.1 TlpA family protein disulfide reductase [Lacinutrix sp. C3R15]MDO6622582.1 TlpA disulfide reductase family protein [Oceanihabitans sp. 1_MG-2023]
MKNTTILLTLLLFSSVLFSQNLPNIDLKSLDGDTVNVTEISNTDTVKVFSFWATWCVPCVNELDAISEVYDEWQEETQVEIIAVSTDDSRTQKRVKPMVNGKGWEYQILLDENQELKRALNISTIPHIVIVKNGEIIYRHSGYTPGAEDELYEIIQEHSK